VIGSLGRGFALISILCAGIAHAQSGQLVQNSIAERIPAHVNRDRSAQGSRIDWIRKADRPFQLDAPTAPFSITYTHNGRTYGLDDYFRHGDTLAFVVLEDQQVVYEKYLHGTTSSDRYLSMSVAKSIVSILVGAAVDEGRIRSVKDPVVKYLPYLERSGYKDATLEDVLRMASGVDFSEEYGNADSGIGLLSRANRTGTPTFAAFAASLGSDVKPGTAFRYQSVNTQVLGLLLEQVTGMPLNRYAEEKLWKKIGAESDAFIVTGEKQPGTCAYSCFFATLRDYARVGLMAMRGGALGGTRVVSEEWIRASTTPAPFARPRLDQSTNTPVRGYGYQWWIPYGEDRDGAFQAVGIRGQTIYVNPARRVVIAQFSAWPAAGARPEHRGESNALFAAIVRELSSN
jgi:CubicO group peptidase (beta-lactamase class C family)